MKLVVTTPFFPRHVDVEAESIIGDPSKRITSGVRFVISWIDSNGEERGMEQFISEESLSG